MLQDHVEIALVAFIVLLGCNLFIQKFKKERQRIRELTRVTPVTYL